MLEPASMKRSSWLKQVAYPLVERKNLSEAVFLHATSAVEAETLEDYGVGVEVKLLPNGVEVDERNGVRKGAFRRGLGLGNREPIVAFLGRVHPIKRLDLLAAAFTLVVAQYPDTHLVIAGPDEGGHRGDVEPLFLAAGARVHWAGKLEGGEKEALLADADVFVSCSDSESFGMSIAEAMLAGLPVVATRTCPWPELEIYGCGFWVDQEVNAIADGIKQVLENPTRSRTMGERGKELIYSKYSWGNIAKTMAEHYEVAIQVHRKMPTSM
jgi:glycosyltransferase involved in cell wall biosynthesis